jgi:hypothetical protein
MDTTVPAPSFGRALLGFLASMSLATALMVVLAGF